MKNLETGNRVAGKLAEACIQQKISYYELSRQSGVPLTTVMHIVNGTTKNPGIYTVVKLCTVLDISLDEMRPC